MGGNVRKGNRLQLLARRILEADGYVVHTSIRTSTKVGPPWKPFWVSQSNDVFNAFDLIATRNDPPRPLRFIQVTTTKMVSERIKKVDPIPINPSAASSEIWAYVGGQRRLDRRYKDRKVWLPRNFFQVYYKERNWVLDTGERVFAGEAEPENAQKDTGRAEEKPVEVAVPRRRTRQAKS